MLIHAKFLLLLLLFLAAMVAPALARTETRSLELPPADTAPATLEIPVSLSRTGGLSAKFSLTAEEWPDDKMVFVSLFQRGYRYVLQSKYYDPRQYGLYLGFDVDEAALERGGEFYFTVVNYSPDEKVSGTVELSYPLKGETETAIGGSSLPNLAVTDLRLDSRCKLQVVIKNLGPGGVPDYFWEKFLPQLQIFKGEQLWGEVDIRYYDYAKNLTTAGGEAVFDSGLKIFGTSRISAVVDSAGVLREVDESDNRREAELVCR